jgi:molybdate transport system substrate-binding protein
MSEPTPFAAATGRLDLLCAGAVKGLVEVLRSHLAGVAIEARFGAVGALQQALREGGACDVLIVTDAMARALEATGELRAGSRTPIGRVATGVAVRSGAAPPSIANGEALKQSLLAASALYFPDADRSTAGAHVAVVLRRLGIHDLLKNRLRMFANGATAMRALADSGDDNAVGCTQVTEIRYSPGLDLVGALPAGFELATVYSAGIGRNAHDEATAYRFIDLLSGADSLALRRSGGFDLP